MIAMKRGMILLISAFALCPFVYAQETNEKPASDNGWSYFELADSLKEAQVADKPEPKLKEEFIEPDVEEFFFEEGDAQQSVFPTLPLTIDDPLEDEAPFAKAAENNEDGTGNGNTASSDDGDLGLGGADPTESNSLDLRTEQKIIDGAYDKVTRREKVALQHQYIRDADVHFSKRLWREVDCRQKMNQHFIYRKQPFVEVLIEILQSNEGRDIAFADDEFSEVLTYDDIQKRLNTVQVIEVLDPETYEYEQVEVVNEINYLDFSTFRIKEDWIFDTRDSQMKPRIVAIAPVRDVFDDNDNYRGQEVLFWMHYDSIRGDLVRYEAFNPYNDGFNLSWTDIFDMRYFDSLITKENNFNDMRIKEYADGRDALLEAERIQKKLFNWEHDLWEY